jgi:hypothetical protein
MATVTVRLQDMMTTPRGRVPIQRETMPFHGTPLQPISDASANEALPQTVEHVVV